MGKVCLISAAICLFMCALAPAAAQAQWAVDGHLVCGTSNNQIEPQLVTDDSGGAVIIWTDGRSYLNNNIYSQRVSAFGLDQWTADGVGICTADDNQTWPELVADGTGGAVMTWSDYRHGGSYSVYVQKVDATGARQWAADGIWVNYGAANSQVILDGSGGVFLSWIEAATYPTSIALQRITSGGSFVWADYVNAGTGNFSRLVADGSGGVVAGWRRWHTANYRIEGQRLDSSGTLLWPSATISPSFGCQFEARIAADGTGGGIMAYEYYGDVIAQRVDGAGAIQWGASGTSPCPDIPASNAPQVISDGAGGGLFVFEVDEVDIYINRILANGNLDWGTGAVVVCNDAATQQDPHLAPDGYGGAYVIWEDHRDYATNGIDIYAQHFDADGNRQWAANGVPICAATGLQNASQIIATGDHSAIITWQDARNGATDLDIYAQAIHYDGSIGDPPFEVVAFSPLTNTIGVSLSANITARFSTPANQTTLQRSAVVVQGSHSGLHAGLYSYNVITQIMTFNPSRDFDHGEIVTVVFTDAIESSSGQPLPPFVYSFTAEAEGLDGEFLAAVNYPVQDGPIALCAALLDSDFDMDLVAANYSSSTISVLIGNGDGTFAPQVTYATGANPHGVIAADIDRDGRLDLVTADYGDNQITVFWNDGGGVFPASLSTSVGAGPESVFAGDFNRDGHLDLATANLGSDDMSVLINDGTGKFGADVVYTAGDNPLFIIGGDLNGDGAIDLVTVNLISDDISVFFNKTTGYFEPKVDIAVGNSPKTVHPADLDKDGDLDLAVAAGSDNQMVLLFNNGDGTFAAPVLYGTGAAPYAGRPADVDGDADLDLVYGNGNSHNIGVRRNLGAGTFDTQADYATSNFPNALVIIDFNGDGALDVASANRYGDDITVLMNKDWISGVESGEVPTVSSLGHAVPNPFNPGTRIEYEVKRDSHVRLVVYNARGGEIITLVNEFQTAQARSVYWDGRNRQGGRVASGVYFYQLQAGDFTEARKMVLIK